MVDDTNATAQRGTPHYRLKAEVPTINLTEDDERILLSLFRHRLLDAHAIRTLLPDRSPDWLGTRLRKLTDARFLTRPVQQRKRRPEGGSWPLTYALGNEGARHLKARYDLPIRGDRWATTSANLSLVHIEHTLEEGRLMLQLQAAAMGRSDRLAFEYADEIYARLKPELLMKKRLPERLRTSVDWQGYRGTEATAPDGLCALRYKNAPPEKSSRYLFLEVDRGTETIVPTKRNQQSRAFWRGSSVLRKFVVYSHGFKAGAHTRIFGIPTFQVLTLTTTAERAEHMMEAYREHLARTTPPIRFLFTDTETLAAHGNDPLAAPIRDGNGRLVNLA